MNTRNKFASAGAILSLLSVAGWSEAAFANDKAEVGYLLTDVKPIRTGVFVDGKYLRPAASFRIDRKYADSG